MFAPCGEMADSCNASSSTDQSTDSGVDLLWSSEDSGLLVPHAQPLLSHLKQAPESPCKTMLHVHRCCSINSVDYNYFLLHLLRKMGE